MKNLNIKKILVPFDFSYHAVNGFNAANKMARLYNAEVVLLYIINPQVEAISSYTLNCVLPFAELESFKYRTNGELQNFIDEKAYKPEKISYKIVCDFLQSAIISETKNLNIDLIIVGHCKSNYLPPITSQVHPFDIIKNTNVPVISVTKKYMFYDFKNLMLPIRNVDNWADKIPFMSSIAKQSGAKIHVIGLDNTNLFTSKKEVAIKIDHAADLLRKDNLRFTVKTFFDKPELESLLDFSLQKRAELVAITPDTGFKMSYIFKPRFFNRYIMKSSSPVMGIKLS